MNGKIESYDANVGISFGTVEYSSPQLDDDAYGKTALLGGHVPEPDNSLRLSGLKAVKWAVDHRAELSELAYGAADEQALEAELQARCGFTKEQCDWVISMSARRLTTAYRTQLDREIDELTEHLTSEP